MSITVLVLAVFFILLFIGLIFYFSFSFESFKESQNKILGERYNVYLSYVINLPELKCSYMGVEKECLDVSKMKLLSDSYYQRVFSGVTEIYVQDITKNKKTVLYQYGAGGEVHSTPVSLYYPENDRYTIGKLYVVIG
mgnify:CR=1 FL=1